MEEFFFKSRLNFIGCKAIIVFIFMICYALCQARTLINTVEIDSIEVFARSNDFIHTTGGSLFPYLYFMEICKNRYFKEDHVWYELIKSKETINGFSQSMAKLKKPSLINRVFKRRTIKGGLFEKPLLCLRISYNNGDKKILVFSENKQFCWFRNEAFLINIDLLAYVLKNIEFKRKEELFLYYGIKT